MGEIRLNYRLETALNDLLALFRADESTAFLATEFLISPGIQEHLTPGSKFAKALDEAERSINKQGFDFWQPPHTVSRVIEAIRYAIARATDTEAKAILLSLLQETDPACIATVSLD